MVLVCVLRSLANCVHVQVDLSQSHGNHLGHDRSLLFVTQNRSLTSFLLLRLD